MVAVSSGCLPHNLIICSGNVLLGQGSKPHARIIIRLMYEGGAVI